MLSLPFKGPNYIWHADGYDKLKPFGITIHGCIDGWVLPTHNMKKAVYLQIHYIQVFEANFVVEGGQHQQ